MIDRSLRQLGWMMLLASLTLSGTPSLGQVILAEEEPGVEEAEFPSKAAPYVRGRLIVKYKDSVLACAHSVFVSKRSFQSITADGSDSLDRLHEAIGVEAVRPLFRSTAQEDALRAWGTPLGATPLMTLRIAEESRVAAVKRRFPLRAERAPPNAKVPKLSHIYELEVPEEADLLELSRRYAADPHVEYAEPRYEGEPDLLVNDPNFGDLWGLTKIEAPAAWDTTTGTEFGGRRAVVAINDSGVDYVHRDLAENIWVNEAESNGLPNVDDDNNGFIDDILGWDFDEDDNDPQGGSHGTHVAGTVGAVGNNAEGVVGVSFTSQLMAIAGFEPEGIIYAADNGADVVNNSWHYPGYSSLIHDVVEYANALGCVVVASAGNQTYGDETLLQGPSNSEYAISVASFTSHDAPSITSSYGVKIDVAAPGTSILSTYPNDSYATLSGTSMAASHVSGLSALILSLRPTLTVEQVRQVLRITADDPPHDPGFDVFAGHGRINARRAVEVVPTMRVGEANILSPTANYFVRGGIDSRERVVPEEVHTYLRGLVEIHGIATAESFSRYELDIGVGQQPSSWTPIYSGTSPVLNGVLVGDWDTGSMDEGIYTLRLRVWNSFNEVFEDRNQVEVAYARILDPPEGAVITGEGPVTISGFADAPHFWDYQLQWRRQGDGPEAWQDLGPAGTAPVPWQTDDNRVAEPQSLVTDLDVSSLPRDFLEVRLVVTDAFGRRYEDQQTWFISQDTYQAGWPKDVNGSAVVCPITTFDLEGDGRLELAVGTNVGELALLRHDGTPVTTSISMGERYLFGAPAVGDVGGDPAIDEVVATAYGLRTGKVSVWQTTDGAPVWEKVLGRTRRGAVLVNLDGDPELEIVVASSPESMEIDQGTVNAWNDDGWSVPGWPYLLPERNVQTTPAVGDVDGDGWPEIVVSSWRHVVILEKDGSLMTSWAKEESHANPILADFDSDGDLEIVTMTRSSVEVRDHTGVVQWSQAAQAGAYQQGSAGDIDGDERPELFLAGERVYAWDAEGNPLPGWPQDTVGEPRGEPTIGDIDGDGSVDIVLGTSAGLVYAWDRDGVVLPDFPKATGSVIYTAVTIADIDRDADTELLVGVDDGRVFVWDLPSPYRADVQPWPMSRQNMRNTGMLPVPSLPSPTASISASPYVLVTGLPFTLTVSGKSPARLASVSWVVENPLDPDVTSIPGVVNGEPRDLQFVQDTGEGANRISHTYTRYVSLDNQGAYQITAIVRDRNYPFSHQATASTVVGAIDPSSCFIATAAYGTPFTSEIQVLRDFRDEVLLEHSAGQQFVSWYYQTSPRIAEVIAHHHTLRTMVRAALQPLAGVARWWLSPSAPGHRGAAPAKPVRDRRERPRDSR